MRQITLIFLLSLGMFSSATAKPYDDIGTGHDLVKVCSKFVQFQGNMRNGERPVNFSYGDYMDIGRCMGFVMALSDTHTFVTSIQDFDPAMSPDKHIDKSSLFCMHNKINHAGQVYMLLDGIHLKAEKNKEELDKPAVLLALEIFIEKFPCKNKQVAASQNSRNS